MLKEFHAQNKFILASPRAGSTTLWQLPGLYLLSVSWESQLIVMGLSEQIKRALTVYPSKGGIRKHRLDAAVDALIVQTRKDVKALQPKAITEPI